MALNFGRSEPRVFVLVFGSESICLLIFPALRTYVQYLIIKKKKLFGLFFQEEAAVLPYSIFVVHGYLHHGGCGW